jgi:DNA recombination protein RmuC
MGTFVAFVLGAVFGAGVVLFVNFLMNRRMRESFKALSFEALTKNTQEFLHLANETLSKQTQVGEKDLEGKRSLIDQSLQDFKSDLDKVGDLVTEFEKDRERKYGELTTQLRVNSEQMDQLRSTTGQLSSVLASTKARGQWGERMAEDVLRLSGFVEGVNYLKNATLETGSTRPDYTFLLPQGLKLNMDVKFPLNSYLKYLESEGDADRENNRDQFLRDVKLRIKEVTTRDYINPQERTVDYCLVFIPNEQVYAFMQEHDHTLIDEALSRKVVLCSPLTLYAILAVVRQAVDNFKLERSAGEILSLLGTFRKQWEMFIRSLDKVGKRIDEAQAEFGTLTTTRRRQLERVLNQVEDLKKQKGIEELTTPTEEKFVLSVSEEEDLS